METKKIIMMPLDSIKPYENNPRNNDGAVEMVAQSIKDFGFKNPIIVDKDNIIIAGHTRLKAAYKLGLKTAPVIIAEDLDEDKVKAFRLVDNRTAEVAAWNFEKLEEELKAIEMPLDAFDFDFEAMGFEAVEEPKEVIEDDIPEINEDIKPTAKLGDIWQLGEHRLMCGDSTDALNINILMQGKKADMVFTDPPYGMNLDTDYSGMSGNGRKGKKYDKVIGDNEDFKNELITTVFNNFGYCNEIFLWGVDYYFDLIQDFKKGSLIVWDKTLQSNGDAGYNSEFELLWSKTPHKKEVIHFNWFRFFGLSEQDIKERKHPTQKPLQVIKPYIEKFSNEQNIIVDLYGGSGSTLIACEQLNRKCYMIELDPKYCDVIIKRWETLTGKKAVLLK